MARLRASWRTSLPVVQQPRNPQSESIARTPYEAVNKATDEAARTARTVTDEAGRVGEQPAQAGADLARRGVETARENMEAGLNTATQTFQRVTDQFTKVLGFSGPHAEELARRSSENIQAVTQPSTVLARGAQEVSQEVF